MVGMLASGVGRGGGNRKIDNLGQTTLGENVHIPSSRVLKYCFGI